MYEKIEKIAKEVYGADGVDYTKAAKKAIDGFIALGADKLPVCMAKTQYSLSDDPTKLGRPSGFRITVSSASLSAGAGFLVCQTGNVMIMPACPNHRRPTALMWTIRATPWGCSDASISFS